MEAALTSTAVGNRGAVAAVIHSEIEKHISAIQVLCEELGVSRLEMYEPELTDSAGNRAPSGFIVTIPETENPGLWAGKLVELEERLSSLLGREVDLLLPGALRNDWVRAYLAPRRIEVYDRTRQHRS